MKAQRHTIIRELLAKAPIASQEELRQKLAARGIRTTQATLSRDIHDLQLSKGPHGYALPSSAQDDDEELPGIREVLSGFGLEVRQAGNLLIVITVSHGAQPIAAGIDYEDYPEVVGTVAGSDTVLVICPDSKQASALKLRMEELIG